MATPAGYAKAVNRFDFTARNRAQNNPPRQWFLAKRLNKSRSVETIH
jgi:hypothetical protein